MITHHKVEAGSPTGGAGTGERRYTAAVFVYSNDPLDTGQAVLEYLINQGFKYGTRWDFGNDSNDRIRLFQISPPQLLSGSAWTWRVELMYQEFKLSVATSTPEIDPTDFLPDIKVRTVGRASIVERATYLGGFNDPFLGWTIGEERTITNSAGTPIALDIDQFNDVVRVVRRTAAVVKDDASFPEFWINSEDMSLSNGFITVPIKKYELKFTGWSMDREQYEGFDLVRVEFTGEIKEGGWRVELLDKGVMVDGCDDNGPRNDGRGGSYSSSNDPPGISTQRFLKDRDGVPVTEDRFLNGAGDVLPPCSDDRFYAAWGPFKEIDPRTLGFFAGITSMSHAATFFRRTHDGRHRRHRS